MKLRVRGPYALYDKTVGAHVVPPAGQYYDSNDPLVAQHRWAFATDAELQAASEATVQHDSVPIEAMTAVPGELRRGPGRPRGSKNRSKILG